MSVPKCQSVFCCGVEHQSRDRFLARFKGYVIYNVVIGFCYAMEAITNYIALGVAVFFFLDAALLAWMASLIARNFGSRQLHCVASLSFVTSVLTLVAAITMQGWSLGLGRSGSDFGAAFWEQGPMVLLFTFMVCISKSLTLLVANSFRLWLSSKHYDTQQGVYLCPGGGDIPALALRQESPADGIAGGVP